MNILVLGSGGREHALIKKIGESPLCEKIYAAPGNGGISRDAVCVDIPVTDLPSLVDFAKKNSIDYVVVAPDDPLAMGAVDLFESEGFKCFGPHKNAAKIESSKSFAKDLMKKYGIPTARYEIFSDEEKALEYIKKIDYPAVIKADGLALGKGVVIAATYDEAKAAIISMMEEKKFGDSGLQIVIEEFMTGPEVSVLSFVDGSTVVPMISSMDHKRALDGDMGLNTGGMGTVAPNPYYTESIANICMEKIFKPTVEAMNKENRPFKGCLYFGLMLTPDGPKVVEYNCRFGDPETQVVMPLLRSDLLKIMLHCTEGTLEKDDVEFSDEYSCCVVMASDGYPVRYEKGFEINVDPAFSGTIYYAGAKTDNENRLVTNGGRVLGVTETGTTLSEAVRKAYIQANNVTFENEYYRKDIGKRALEAQNID